MLTTLSLAIAIQSTLFRLAQRPMLVVQDVIPVTFLITR
jgi:hypothetical protein